MFPLSEMFVFAVVYAAFFALATLVFYGIMRSSRRGAFLLGLGGTVLAFLLVFGATGPFYDTTGEVIVILLTVSFSPAIAAIWAYLAWRFSKTVPVALGVCLLPSVLSAAVFFERQRLPDGACARSHIPVRIGERRYDVPLAFGGDVFLTRERWALRATQGARFKEGLKRLCAATKGGETAALAARLWLAPSLNGRTAIARCEGSAQLGKAPFCEGFKSRFISDTGSLIVEPKSDTSLRYVLSKRGKDAAQGHVFVGDETAGYMCKVTPGTRLARNCRMWRSLGSNVAILTSIDFGRNAREVGQLTREMSAAFDYYLRAMGRAE